MELDFGLELGLLACAQTEGSKAETMGRFPLTYYLNKGCF